MPDNEEQKRLMYQRAWENLQSQTAKPQDRGVTGLGTAMDIDLQRQSRYAPQGWQIAVGPNGERVMVPAAQSVEPTRSQAAQASVADQKLQEAAKVLAKRATPKKLSPEELSREADKIQKDLDARDKRWAETPAITETMGGRYDTKLTPEEEERFQEWRKHHVKDWDSGADYDFRGAYKAGVGADPNGGHWPDTFKKPNHETFSDESQYATGDMAKYAGHWEGDNYTRAGDRPKNELTGSGWDDFTENKSTSPMIDEDELEKYGR